MFLGKLKVRSKMLALLVGVSTLSIGAVCVAFIRYDSQSSAQAKHQTMDVLGAAIAGAAAGPTAFQDTKSAIYVLDTLSAEPTAQWAGIYLHTPKDEKTDGTLLAAWPEEGSAAPETLDPIQGYHDGVLTIHAPVKGQGGQVGDLVIQLSTTDLQARSEDMAGIALKVLIVTSLLVTLLAVLVQRLITGPIDRLVQGAHKVSEEGDYSVRVVLENQDEFGELAGTFNAMLEGIQERDAELVAHQEKLEERVRQRTRDLDQRNAAMRLVLDNVDQGLVSLSPEGVLAEERSAAFDAMLGQPTEGETLGGRLSRLDPKAGEWFSLCWESLTDGFLPLEMAIEQLPQELQLDDAHFTLSFKPLLDGEQLQGMLAVITDVTSEVEQRRKESVQRERLAVFQHLMRDREAFSSFLDEASGIVASLRADSGDDAVTQRQLHTLKGNAGIYGLERWATRCHALEQQYIDGEPVSEQTLDQLAADWSAFTTEVRTLAGEHSAGGLVIDAQELQGLRHLLRSGVSSARVEEELERLSGERVVNRLDHLGRSASELARKLGKPLPTVEVNAGGFRLDRETYSELWSSLVHLVRNAVDHGLEDAEGRAQAGKPAQGTLRMRLSPYRGAPSEALVLGTVPQQGLCLEIQDDGSGIAWERIAQRAAQAGLPADTPLDHFAALFADGLSSREQVSETSGRGVGMAAVLDEVKALGGAISVRSEPGEGSHWKLWLPHAQAARARLVA
ncbi:MAG: HAMP domain-containing protein [Myxococcota bacterium]|nr:HAMP domain-containing protein [Myxococcota bacterium]